MKDEQGSASALGAWSGRGRQWLVGWLSVLALAGCGQAPLREPDEAAFHLTLLHINDHHSNLDSRSKTLQLRNAAQVRVPVQLEVGGFARLTTAFHVLAAESPSVLKLHAGDAITGTLYFDYAGAPGEADAALMNTVCFDALALGNHEFDKGDTALRQWLALLRAEACQTPVLSANVQFGPGSALHPQQAPGWVQPYVVLQRQGEPIGVVGLTIAKKTKESSQPDPGTEFESERLAAQRAINALREQGVNKVVVLSHVGYGLDQELAAELSGVDVIVGGDSHTLLGPAALNAYGVGSPAGPYPHVLQNRDGDPVCVVQAWEYGQVLGELKVSFDADGRVLACAGTPHVLVGDTFLVNGEPPSASDQAAFLADLAASGFLRVTAPDAKAQTVLQPYHESIEVFKRTAVAVAPQALCSRRVPGGPGSVDYVRSSPACNAEGLVAVRGGDIQQLVAQAYWHVANSRLGGAHFALQGGGGVRVPLEGQVMAADVLEMLPFDQTLWRLTVTGAEMRQAVEEGLEVVFRPGGTTGAYPYVAGLRWRLDARMPTGARASKFEVYDQAMGRWQPLNEAQQYRLFVPSFNAGGGDGYTTFAQVPPHRRLDVGVKDVDVFLDYLESLPRDASGLPVLRRPDPAWYSTAQFVGALPD